MTNEVLLRCMSLLDDELINEAMTAKKKKRAATRFLPLAACLCLAMLAGLGVQQSWFSEPAVPKGAIQEYPGIMQPAFPDTEKGPAPEPREMISSYGSDGAAACYKKPEDGFVGFSIPLHAAMEAYGDGPLYRVAVDMFCGDEQLPPDGERAAKEAERLTSLGYTVAFETVGNGEDEGWRTFFTLQATYEQLQSFEATDDIGYMLFLYGERVHPEEG